MTAILVYRTVLLVRGCWLLGDLVWYFGWGRFGTSDLIHPYASLFVNTLVAGFLLIALIGLWCFRRWARWTFVLLLAPAIADLAVRQPHTVVPNTVGHVMRLFVLILNGTIVAMSFLPPVRDIFAKQDLTNR
jgi:hypothetical protein